MVISIRKWIEIIRIIIIFCLLTFFFYQIISWTLDVLSPRYQYKKPYGSSVEVHYPLEESLEVNPVKERIYYFWGNGE